MISHPKVFHASSAEVRVLFSGFFVCQIFVLRFFCFCVRLGYDLSFCSAEAVFFCGSDFVIQLCGSLFFVLATVLSVARFL